MGTVTVIATSEEGTREALHVAAALADSGSAKLVLFVRSGERPRSPASSSMREPVVLTYDGRAEDLAQLVPKSASIVVGGRGGLWRPTPEQQLAKKFADLGYRVVFALSAKP